LIYQIRNDEVFISECGRNMSRFTQDFIKIDDGLYATYMHNLSIDAPLVIVRIPDEVMFAEENTRSFKDKELFVNKATKDSRKYLKSIKFKKELENI
jgi:hypothetical protein